MQRNSSNVHPASDSTGLTYQVSVQYPVGMEVVNAVKDLVEQGLHHAFGHLNLSLLPGFDCPVILDNVLWGERGEPE